MPTKCQGSVAVGKCGSQADVAGRGGGQEKAVGPSVVPSRLSRVRMKTPTVRGVLDLNNPGEPPEEESPG